MRAVESDVKSLTAEVKFSTFKRCDIAKLVDRKVNSRIGLDKASRELTSLEAALCAFEYAPILEIAELVKLPPAQSAAKAKWLIENR